VQTVEDAETFARALLDPGRSRPVVVVSIPSGRAEPWIDVGGLVSAVGGLADVAVVPTSAASWRLAELLPERTQVYGGAGRAYPTGTAWQDAAGRPPLRFAYGAHDAAEATEALITDALGMAAAARPAQRPAARSRAARGVVRGLVPPSRAIVRLENDGVATIWSELTAPGVPIDRLIRLGQVVRGALDPETRRLDVAEMLPAPDPLVPAYVEGDVVLARVAQVRPDVVHLALLPDVVVPVPADRVTSNPLDRLTALFTLGETVLARVARREEGRLYLRLDDIEDDEAPWPAPAILLDGPPWLVPPEDAEDDAEEGVGAQPAPGQAASGAGVSAAAPAGRVAAAGEGERGPTPRDVLATRATVALEGQVRAFRERAIELEVRVRELEDKVRNQRTALRKEKQRQQRAAAPRTPGETAVRGGAGTGAGAPAFLEPAEQFQHEVYLAWVRRIPAGQKAERPLATYRLAPVFLPSLDAVEGVERAKVVQVVVEVLTGLAESLGGRDLHQLRESESGNSAPVTREGGWTAWRVALQQGSPAARRLHYWRRGSEVELARVVLHDDLRM
jgi:hypothetical protein